jgi:hypothetical protein
LVATAAHAQENGAVEDSTPWNPEAVPAQTTFELRRQDRADAGLRPEQILRPRLETGETVQSTDANEDDWSVTATTYGAGKLAKPMILVTPFAPGSRMSSPSPPRRRTASRAATS